MISFKIFNESLLYHSSNHDNLDDLSVGMHVGTKSQALQIVVNPDKFKFIKKEKI
jgi:hypothetical protein